MKQLTSKELAELFLVILYDILESQRGELFIPLESTLSKMGITDAVLGKNIAYFLQIKKLIVFRDSEIRPLVTITDEGKLHVRMGGESGIIRRYRESPDSFIPK